MKITEHFTLEELTVSNTAVRMGLDNTCPEELIDNMTKVATALEVIRAYYGLPITVLSCYRSPEVNKACGGSKTSAHRFALAADFRIKGVPNIEICKKIPELLKDFDQVIYEFGPSGWIHLGFRVEGNRKQLLSAVKRDKKTVYLPGIV